MRLIACSWCSAFVDASHTWCPRCGHNPKPVACLCRICTKGDTRPGQYYGVPRRGPLVPVPPGRPDRVICRRVADYPQGTPPAAAARGVCVTCGAPIAFNPAGPHQDAPKVCMRCAGIQPLPFTVEES
jgi:hypothetical protein